MNKTLVYSLVGILIVLLFIFAGFALSRSRSPQSIRTPSSNTETFTQIPPTASQSTSTTIAWQQSGDGWQSIGTPPPCPNPLTLKTPIDLSKVTAVLYPGQTRGGNYKPHGGFIFKNSKNDDITVTVPMDAQVIRGTRYVEAGEVQNLFDLIAPCGVMFRFDHLRTLSPAFQTIADTFPAASESSETHNLTTSVSIKAGDAIATSVGFVKTSNVSVDWGVYDLRAKNASSKDSAWATQHQNDKELAPYAVCWFDWLSASDSAKVKSLPAGDQQNGKTSDYCK